MLIYRLILSNRANLGFQITYDGVIVFSLDRKIVGGEIINTPLTSSVGLMGLYFRNASLKLLWRARQEMSSCTFLLRKFLRFKKIMRRQILRFEIGMQWWAKNSAKELSYDV